MDFNDFKTLKIKNGLKYVRLNNMLYCSMGTTSKYPG